MRKSIVLFVLLQIACMGTDENVKCNESSVKNNDSLLGKYLIDQEQFEALVKYDNIDSIYNFLRSYSYIDSTIKDIDSEFVPGYSVPDYILDLDDRDKIALVLLDTLKNYVQVLLNKEFEKGQYGIFYNQDRHPGDIYSIKSHPFYLILEISAKEYKYTKAIIMK